MQSRTFSRLNAFCIASGPSLTESDTLLVREWREKDPSSRMVLVCNNAWEMCPWADILLSVDQQWWTVYGPKVKAGFEGKTYAAHRRNHFAEEAPFKFFGNSGATLISAAQHFGAKNAFLLGFDGQFTGGKTHFHGSHVSPLSDAKSVLQWPAQFQRVAGSVAKSMKVINCTRTTALKCFERKALEEVL